jgi:hypothetical protein
MSFEEAKYLIGFFYLFMVALPMVVMGLIMLKK